MSTALNHLEMDAMTESLSLDARALQELHIQRELMDNSKFNTPMKKLVEAFKCVERGRVTVGTAPGVYRVQGSKGNEYFVNNDGCNCPNGLHSAKTKYGCYHSVAVELYKRWQAAMQPMLTLPPSPADERLAAPAPTKDDPRNADRFQAHIEGEAPGTHPHECRACGCGWVCRQRPCAETPELMCPDCLGRVEHETILDVTATKETAMAAPRDDEYIPEPTPALEPVHRQDTAKALALLNAMPVTATTMNAAALEASLEEWSKQRAVLTRFIKQHLVEGVDYGKIHVAGSCDRRYDCTNPKHLSKDCLFKPGSEKVLGLLRLRPEFTRDEETWDMLGRPPGVLFYRCTLLTPSGEVAGEGRGARDVQKDKGDINKAVKMAQKTAQIDAILRTGHLSDAFTQDLDQEPEVHAPAPDPAPAPRFATTDEEDRKAIVYYLRKLYGMNGASKEQWAAAVLEHTGLRLVPEHYREIVRKLRALMDEGEAALDGSTR